MGLAVFLHWPVTESTTQRPLLQQAEKQGALEFWSGQMTCRDTGRRGCVPVHGEKGPHPQLGGKSRAMAAHRRLTDSSPPVKAENYTSSKEPRGRKSLEPDPDIYFQCLVRGKMKPRRGYRSTEQTPQSNGHTCHPATVLFPNTISTKKTSFLGKWLISRQVGRNLRCHGSILCQKLRKHCVNRSCIKKSGWWGRVLLWEARTSVQIKATISTTPTATCQSVHLMFKFENCTNTEKQGTSNCIEKRTAPEPQCFPTDS